MSLDIKIIVVLIFFTNFTYAQQRIEDPTFKKDGYVNFSQYLSDEFDNDKIIRRFDSLCTSDCLFIKFNFDKKGTIENIKTNLGNKVRIELDSLIKYFEFKIKQTEKNWIWNNKIDGLNSKTKTYLIPIIFNFENGKCQKENPIDIYHIKYEFINSLLNMIDFEKPKIDSLPRFKSVEIGQRLECTILQPIYVNSPVRSSHKRGIIKEKK